jgi:hypothetical protein
VLAIVERSPLGQALGHERMFFNLEQAVARYLEKPGKIGDSLLICRCQAR